MSIRTETDDKLESLKFKLGVLRDELRKASDLASEIWGTDEYSKEYREKLQAADRDLMEMAYEVEDMLK